MSSNQLGLLPWPRLLYPTDRWTLRFHGCQSVFLLSASWLSQTVAVWWNHMKISAYPYLHDWCSLVDRGHIQIAQIQWIFSVLCHLPTKELMHWGGSEELKRAAFSLPSSVVAALGTSGHAEHGNTTTHPCLYLGTVFSLGRKTKLLFSRVLVQQVSFDSLPVFY